MTDDSNSIALTQVGRCRVVVGGSGDGDGRQIDNPVDEIFETFMKKSPMSSRSCRGITSLPMHDSPDYQSNLPRGYAPFRLYLSSTLKDWPQGR